MSIVESLSSFHCVGTARILVDDREMAWAEPYVRRADDVKWILGNYVQTATADVPTYNSNGHSFPLEDMAESLPNLNHRPLNINHAPDVRVGTFVASELVYPEGMIDGAGIPPIAEALAAYWYYYDEKNFAKVERAFKDGVLFFSMEAIPKQITCAQCNTLFDYHGPQHDEYCDHLQSRSAKKVLHKPKFLGGALIVPPIQPGWSKANIKEISQLLEKNTPLVDEMYTELAASAPHLESLQLEELIFQLVTS